MGFLIAQLRQTLQNIKYRIKHGNNINKYTITTSNIIKYTWDDDTNGFSSWSITLDEMTEIPQDMHKKVCDKTIRNGAHCLILRGQTRDYVNVLFKKYPDVKEHIIYAYFI